MEEACWFRATTNRLRFIYVWTVNDHDLMREYIRIGVDGIITDHASDLHTVMQETEFRPIVRYATRDDNPFQPANQTYGLAVHTGNKSGAGTDADITFTLSGAAGSASITVNAGLPGRMETGGWNYVTLPGAGLGPLQTITVQHDGQGAGSAWFLDKITVATFNGINVQAVFNCWIDSGKPVSQPLSAIDLQATTTAGT